MAMEPHEVLKNRRTWQKRKAKTDENQRAAGEVGLGFHTYLWVFKMGEVIRNAGGLYNLRPTPCPHPGRKQGPQSSSCTRK